MKQKYVAYETKNIIVYHVLNVPKHIANSKAMFATAKNPMDAPSASLLITTAFGDARITTPSTTVAIKNPLPSVEPMTTLRSGSTPSLNSDTCA